MVLIVTQHSFRTKLFCESKTAIIFDYYKSLIVRGKMNKITTYFQL